MDVSTPVWIGTIVLMVGMVLYDLVFHVRKAHRPTLRESAIWSSVYIGIAVVFGVGVLFSVVSRSAPSTSRDT